MFTPGGTHSIDTVTILSNQENSPLELAASEILASSRGSVTAVRITASGCETTITNDHLRIRFVNAG